ncbi:methyl-accepting chemotaxis (MCP) signaling domain protein, partial [Vibrio parahaemolyticus V-223/04]
KRTVIASTRFYRRFKTLLSKLTCWH